MVLFIALISFKGINPTDPEYYSIQDLKKRYSSGDVSQWPAPTIDSTVVDFKDLAVLPPMEHPSDNPLNDAKRALGKLLFYDPRLSSSGQISCASCHDPQLGWSDGKKVSHGHNRQLGKRNSKSIINTGYLKTLFWDGKVSRLENQIDFPIKEHFEMNNSPENMVKTIQDIPGYATHFTEAFGDKTIDKDRIFKAIATFERTIVSRKSRFDKFISGDSTQLNNQEILGLHLFRTKARCLNCHNSALLTDEQFHNAGLTYYKRKYQDLGLYEITKKPEDVGKFKTPTLRELAHTGPYMHNGLFPQLRGVLNMYNAGMPNLKPKETDLGDIKFPATSSLLKKLDLNEEELQALEAFLLSLSSPIYHEPDPEHYPQ